jgi:sulfite reductase (NADPH) hemoprotein beta-component
MLLGGGYYGQRLNKIYRGLSTFLTFHCATQPQLFFFSFFLAETVTEPEILAILKPMIKRYALERTDGEQFGDFVIRAGYIAPTTAGKEWYDRMGGEGQYREA